jgi:maleylpyruvate isomerase
VDEAQRELSVQIDYATQRLLSTARVATEPELRAPSMLPGWSRAHVLAHLARNADALRTLLIGARDGRDLAAYASSDAREADIEQGAAQQPAALVADLASSAMAFRTITGQLSAAAWQYPVRTLDSEPFPAGQVLLRRLVEVELHHCDLGLAYTPADWPASFADRDLPEPFGSQRAERVTWLRTAESR